MNSASPHSYPLKGLRILDLGTMVAGPVACTLLADFGAEVIKVEVPKRGDTVRDLGPFVEGECLYWQVEGRSKKSITLDLRVPEGQQLLLQLVEQVDAVVENFRPGTLEAWNLGYEELKQRNSKLIMLRISGFGQTGPYRSRAGYDRIGLAMGGLMGITGFPNLPPVRSGTSTADYQTALMGAFALMMAVYRRDSTNGDGEEIDVSLYESVFRFTEMLVPEYDLTGVVRGRSADKHFTVAPGGYFRTCDGRDLVLSVSCDEAFHRLCQAMESPDLGCSPDYATHSQRWQRIDELNSLVADWVESQPVERLCGRLDEAKIAYSFIHTVEDLLHHPHCIERRSIATVHHSDIGPFKMSGVVPRFMNTPTQSINPAPALGQHNSEIYCSLLGLSQEKVNALKNQGVV